MKIIRFIKLILDDIFGDLSITDNFKMLVSVVVLAFIVTIPLIGTAAIIAKYLGVQHEDSVEVALSFYILLVLLRRLQV